MIDESLSRRAFSGSLAAGLAAVWLGHHRAAWREEQATDDPRFLTSDETRDLEAFAALIVPTDQTPGAREAKVVRFIDRGLATFAADQQKIFRDGLRELASAAGKLVRGTRSFAGLGPAQQTAFLKSLESAKSPFFEAARTAAITGFLADPKYGGNVGKVGWKAIGYDDRSSWQPPFGYYDRPVTKPGGGR